MAESRNLIPNEVVEELNKLDQNLKDCIKSSGTFLKSATEINKTLSTEISTWKELNKIVAEYNQLESGVIEAQKKQQKIIEQKNTLVEKTIKKNSQQVKEAQNINKALEEEKETFEEVIKEVESYIVQNEKAAATAQELASRLYEVKNGLDYTELLKSVSEGTVEAYQAVNMLGNNMARIGSLQSEYKEALDDGRISIEEYNKAVSDLNAVYNEASKATDSLQKSNKDLKDTTESLLNVAYKNLSDEMMEVIGVLTQEQILLKQTKDAIKELDKEYKSGNITIEEYLDNKNALISLEEQQSTSVKRLTTQRKLLNQAAVTEIGSYDNLSAQYGILKLQINALGEAEEEEIKRKRELEEQANGIYAQMIKLQESTGKHQLKVGDYNGAVKDLTKTISLLDPRVGAIINKAKAITPVKQAWVKVNEQLVKSLNVTAKTATILQAAIGGLVVGALILAYNATKKYIEAKQQLNKINEEVAKNVGNELAELNLLYSAVTNTNNSYEERIKYVEKLQDKYPEYLRNVDRDKLLNGELAGTFDRLRESIIKAARARAVMEKVAEIESKIVEIEINRNKNQEKLNASFSYAHENTSEYQKALVSLINADDEKITKLREEAKAYTDLIDIRDVYSNQGDEIKNSEEAIYGLEDLRLKKAIETSREIISNTANEYGTRLSALNNYTALQIQAAELSKKKQLEATGLTAEQRKLIEAQTEAEITRIQRDGKKEQEKLLQDYNNTVYQSAAFQLSTNAQIQSEILSDNQKKYTERQKALEEFYNLQTESIKLAGKNQIEQVGVSETAKTLITAKTNAELVKLDRDRNKRAKELIQVYVKEQTDSINDLNESRQNAIGYSESEDLKILAEQYKKGAIKQKQYEKEKTEITRQYAKERFEAEIQTLNDLLKVTGLTDEQTTAIKQQARDAEYRYNQMVNQQIISDDEDAAKKRKKLEEDLKNARIKLAQEVANFATQIISNTFTAQLRNIENELSALSDYYEERNKIIDEQENAGVVTAEYAAAQRAQLAEEQAEKEAALEEKSKEIQLRQAKFEKAQAVISAGINTAVAISKQLSVTPLPLGAPLIATIAAIGAAQIATILAQPLPQYKHGTSDHPGGAAIVGDGGRPEMVLFPDGSFFKTPAVSTMVDLPAHTQVFPDYQKAMNAMSFSRLDGEVEKQVVVMPENREQVFLQREGNRISREILSNQKKERLNSKYSFLYSKVDNKNNYKSF